MLPFYSRSVLEFFPECHGGDYFGDLSDNAILYGKCESPTNFKWGYLDKDHKTLISPQYHAASSFSNGTALIEMPEGKYFTIDKNGQIIKEHFLSAKVEYSKNDDDIYYKKGDILNVLALSGLNLREEPSVGSKSIVKVNCGESVEVLELPSVKFTFEKINGYWLKVKYREKEGYIFDGYLSKYPAPENKGKEWDKISEYVEKQVQVGKPVNSISLIVTPPYDDYDSSEVEYIVEFKGNIYIHSISGYENRTEKFYLPDVRLSEARIIGLLCGGIQAQDKTKPYYFYVERDQNGHIYIEFDVAY